MPNDDASVPEWTDHDVSDPGVTLLQAIAYSVTALVAVGAVRRWWSHRRSHRDGS